MLTFGYGGTDTPHAVGCVCEHVNDYYWYIAQHQTAYAYDINGKTYDGTLGEIMIIPPGDFMHHTNQKGADIGFVDDYMYFAGEEVEKMVERLKLPVSIAEYTTYSGNARNMNANSDMSIGYPDLFMICW